jgi:hypothetical protein
MIKTKLIVLVLFVFSSFAAESQSVIVMPRRGYTYHPRGHNQKPPQSQKKQTLPKFTPSLNIYLGYGFPNLDKYQLASGINNAYVGNITQNGPFAGSIDYRFSRNMGIGVLVTNGQVNAPYYNYYSGKKDYNASLDNWSVMLNLMNYIPVNSTKVTPYFRTAIGVNIWNQNYTDASDNKLNSIYTPTDLAYQISLGSSVNITKSFGFFGEVGYGKYILLGGLCLKF